MSNNDRSDESLLARRAKAEAATQGPWRSQEDGSRDIDGDFVDRLTIFAGAEDAYVATVHDFSNMAEDAAHIAANSPDVIIADIDELLRLRAEVARLDREADWLAENGDIGECPPNIERDSFGVVLHCTHNCEDCWREAARKAVEESCKK